MKFVLTSLVLGVFSAPAMSGLPANCIDRLVSKSENYLVEVEKAVQKQTARAENDLNRVRKTWGEFARYYQGKWAADCMAAAPQNKGQYNEFLKNRATPVMHLARERSEEICSNEGSRIIAEGMAKIDQAIADNNQGQAESQIRFLETKLRKKDMLAKCRPIKDRVASLLQTELPNLRANAGNIKHINDVGRNYPMVTRMLGNLDKAFAEQQIAPLEGKQSQVDFRNAVNACLAGAKALDAAGFDANGVVTTQGAKTITLAEARKPCEDAEARDLDQLFTKVQAHNDRYRKEWRAKWEQNNLKGDAMKKVYEANNRHLPRVEDLGSMVVWTYWSHTTGHLFAECKGYSFDGAGSRLISRKVYACE